MIYLLLLALLAEQAATIPTPAILAPVTPTPVASSAETPKPPKPTLLCVTESVMGSNFPKRTCATAEQWKGQQKKEAEQMDRLRNQSGACSGESTRC